MKKSVKTILALAVILAMCATVCPASADAATYKNINKKQAKAIALKNAKVKSSKACWKKVKYDKGDRTYELKFKTRKNGKCRTYNYEIDKVTGRILERDIDFWYKKTCSRKKIGKKAVLKKVIKVSKLKASIVKSGTCTYRYKDREGTYQVKFRYGNLVYEYELLGPSARIKEIEFKYKPLKK